MAMNVVHRFRCSSTAWADQVRDELLPWALAGVDLGEHTLEIGPGYGATLRALVERVTDVTAVEVDADMAARLDARYSTQARVIHADGAHTGLAAASFDSVVCFTMLHHVPTDTAQDSLFAEAFRVLKPGGVFAGSDRLGSALFRLIHLRDTYNPVHPDGLETRLRRVGFGDVSTDVAGSTVRWRAFRPRTR